MGTRTGTRDPQRPEAAVKVQIQIRELFDRGLWLEASQLLCISEWALNEGQVDPDEWLDLTEQDAVALGLLPPSPA